MKKDPKWLEFLREQFPRGSRIELREMNDPYPVEPGTKGTLEGFDGAGHLLVRWDNGRTLNLVLGEDRFQILPPELTTLKLYMPLNAQLYERNEYGDQEDTPAELDGRELMDYQDSILAAILKERMPAEKERGLMTYYGKDDSVNQKVRSYNFTVEARQGRLWGVAECEIAGKLTGEEMAVLKEAVSGQASDGLGEGFEQREIETSNGGLYVSLWSGDKGWSIQTEQERFAPELAEGLPEMCFSILPGEGRLICIKRGETGYYPSDWETGDLSKNRELADHNNERLGVTKVQEEAMLTGSMLGWDCPGADPAWHEEYGQPQTGGMTLG